MINVDTLNKRLEELAKHYGVFQLANFVLENPKFKNWSGSSRPEQHHYGQHGLIIHTSEVIDLCLQTNNYFPANKKVDEAKLFLAALFHDVGKIWDYQPEDSTWRVWSSTAHKSKVHHITRSALVWQEAKIYSGFDDPSDDVLHAILAHHGLREWGSPVRPATRIAWLLHLCDGISARMDDCETFSR